MINNNFEATFASVIKDYNNANGLERIDILIKFAVSIIIVMINDGKSIDEIIDMIKEIKNKMEEN